MEFSKNLLLKDTKRELTGIEFEKNVSGLSLALKEFVEPGDYIAIQMDHGIEYILAIFALANVGAIPVLIPTRLHETQIKNILTEYEIPTALARLPQYSASSAPLRDLTEQEIVLFTSGSSSTPKAAVLTFNNFLFNALGSNEHIPFSVGDKWLMSLPLYHVGGLSIFFRALAGGGCAYFSSATDSNVTHISMVHTQLFRFLQNPHATYYKAVLLGGSAFPENLLIQGMEFGLPLYRSYGMTEMASQIATTEKNNLKTSGKPLAHREIRITDGEIFVRGKTLFKGFLDKEASFSIAGWYATNDLGHLAEDGSLVVTGRKDRMFVCGGENIQPEAIEGLLMNYPGVYQTRVTAQSDPQYGHVPVAYVDSQVSTDELKDFLKNRLSGFQVPREILPFAELPINLKTTKDL